MTFRLGTLELQSPYLLAPLEAVSDIGFRRLCYANGAGITWTEMVRASGVARRNKATLDLIDTFDPQTLTGVQLFAANERELDKALEVIEELAFTTHPHFQNIRAIDLNFGCPSPELVRLGAGPALLKRTAKMTVIFQTLRAWKERTKLNIGAVGAKIRLGLNAREVEHKVYLRLMEPANQYLDYFVVHARHAGQRSRDAPQWEKIAELKALAKIPLIGNGNALSAADAQRMMKETGCDGVLVARGAINNPWMFRALTGRGAEKPTPAEVEQAWDDYQEIAQRFATKPKYLDFHGKNFERIHDGKPYTRSPDNSNFT